MPISLPAPHVLSGFPPLHAADDQTAHPGGPTALKTEANGQTILRIEAAGLTVSPISQTTPRTEADGPTTRPA
jgi:hypothetical protein